MILPKEIRYQLSTLRMCLTDYEGCLTDYEDTQDKTGFGDITSKKKALDYVLSDYQTLPEPFVTAVRRLEEVLGTTRIGHDNYYNLSKEVMYDLLTNLYKLYPELKLDPTAQDSTLQASSIANAVNAIHKAYASEAKPSEDTRSLNEPREAVGVDLNNILRILKSIDDVLLKHDIQFKFIIKF